MRDSAKQLAKHLPGFMYKGAKQAEEYGRGIVVGGGTLFEEMGFYYVGPIDGHNLDHLLPILKNVKEQKGPVLVHVVTRKGHGYAPAEAANDKYHAVNTFDVIDGKQSKPKANAPAYTKVFADALVQEASDVRP